MIAALFFIFPLIIFSAIEQVMDVNEQDDEDEEFKRRNGEE